MIEFINVSKRYKNSARNAVNNLNLKINQGEVFGFIGPNGAGKSSTIKMLLNIIPNYQGKILLQGKNASDHKSRAGLGFVAESPILPDQLTPIELIEMGAAMRGHPNSKHVSHIIEQLSLAPYANKRIASLSKGNIQRTAIAHALIGNPQLLILDEPLSGLDPIGRHDVVNVLMEYKKQGGTLFFSSHVLHDVERLADQFGLIHNGELLAQHSPAELLLAEDNYVIVHATGKLNPAIWETDDNYRFQRQIARSNLWLSIDEIQKAGGQIIEIKPAMTLERYFINLITPSETQRNAA